MRAGLFAFAAMAIIAATVPASAQDFRVRAGEDGVGIRVGRDHDRDNWRESRGDHCRTVVVKHRAPDGTVIIRKTRHCD